MSISLPMVIECPKDDCRKKLNRGKKINIRYICPHCRRYFFIWEVKRFFKSIKRGYGTVELKELDYSDVVDPIVILMERHGIDIKPIEEGAVTK